MRKFLLALTAVTIMGGTARAACAETLVIHTVPLAVAPVPVVVAYAPAPVPVVETVPVVRAFGWYRWHAFHQWAEHHADRF